MNEQEYIDEQIDDIHGALAAGLVSVSGLNPKEQRSLVAGFREFGETAFQLYARRFSKS